jgi:hypothetical protein
VYGRIIQENSVPCSRTLGIEDGQANHSRWLIHAQLNEILTWGSVTPDLDVVAVDYVLAGEPTAGRKRAVSWYAVLLAPDVYDVSVSDKACQYKVSCRLSPALTC